jgi:phosphatidylserine decarboxylase
VKRPFSGWREGAPFYLPALVVGGGLAAWAFAADHPIAGVIALLPAAFMLNFFRDPPRTIPHDAHAIVSPADGKVTAVEDLASTPWYDGPCKRVSIFLSVIDVHVNRAPDDATIVKSEHKAGVFKNAMDPESSELNEAVTLWLETPHGPMTVRQIAGLIARRIVCPVKPGECLTRGQRFGMIRFGSRTDLYLRADARVVVRPGDRVRGASTVIAQFD